MRVLLDTHVLLWTLAQPLRLDRETRATIEAADTEVLFSAASIWEIATKAGLGRRDFALGGMPGRAGGVAPGSGRIRGGRQKPGITPIVALAGRS